MEIKNKDVVRIVAALKEVNGGIRISWSRGRCRTWIGEVMSFTGTGKDIASSLSDLLTKHLEWCDSVNDPDDFYSGMKIAHRRFLQQCLKGKP